MSENPNTTKPVKVPPEVALGGILLLLYLGNYGAVQLGWPPYVWCWGLHLVPFVEGWYQMVILVVLAWFAFVVFRRGVVAALWPSFVVVMVFSAPVVLEVVLGLGVGARCVAE
jgi:hypothetical protein